MSQLQFTLVCDGPSDSVMLIPILEWLLRQYFLEVGVKVNHARPDLVSRESNQLGRKIEFALKAFPCRCLFVHRDAEGQDPDRRRGEIQAAINSLGPDVMTPHVCVVPVRMTEAWLLFNESAIRQASGNPNGRGPLILPRLRQIEDHSNPKHTLHELLTNASGLKGRRRQSFEPRQHINRLADLIVDFSPLRELPAFLRLEDEVRRLVEDNEWGSPLE